MEKGTLKGTDWRTISYEAYDDVSGRRVWLKIERGENPASIVTLDRDKAFELGLALIKASF